MRQALHFHHDRLLLSVSRITSDVTPVHLHSMAVLYCDSRLIPSIMPLQANASGREMTV
jgi:hypothetical protein